MFCPTCQNTAEIADRKEITPRGQQFWLNSALCVFCPKRKIKTNSLTVIKGRTLCLKPRFLRLQPRAPVSPTHRGVDGSIWRALGSELLTWYMLIPQARPQTSGVGGP